MYLSKASTYGIRSVAYLASKEKRTMISVRELSSELQIPAAFLTKIMQRLASKKIVVTMRGFGGGVALGKSAGEITLREVIMAIDGEESFPCFWLGIPDDQLEQIPAFHKKWLELINNIDVFFTTTRFTELVPTVSETSMLTDGIENMDTVEGAKSKVFPKNSMLNNNS